MTTFKKLLPILFLLINCMLLNAQDTTVYHVKCGSQPLYETEGTLANSDGHNPEMKADNTTGIKVGDYGEMTKYFEKHIGKGTFSGWTLIGNLEVVSIDGNIIHFKLAE